MISPITTLTQSPKPHSPNPNAPDPASPSPYPHAVSHANPAIPLPSPTAVRAVREAPNQLFANVLHGTEQALQIEVKPANSASTIQSIEIDFLRFYRKMRGVSTRNLPIYLTWYRMLHLLDAVNPRILADEMFKLCLDKNALSYSRRLIKKLI